MKHALSTAELLWCLLGLTLGLLIPERDGVCVAVGLAIGLAVKCYSSPSWSGFRKKLRAEFFEDVEE